MKVNRRFLQISIFLIVGLTLGKIYPLVFTKPNTLKQTQNADNLIEKKEKTLPSQKKEDLVQCTIKGAVKKPGTYFLKKNSMLQDLIQRAGGFSEGANKRIKNYYLKNGAEFTIKYESKIRVEIKGEIKNPGFYEMYMGQTLENLVSKAGGLTPFGILPKKNYFLKDGASFYIKGSKKTKEQSND